jgi:hypothetical protein
MRHRRLNGTGKKPAILKDKIILATYINANFKVYNRDRPAHGYYWRGVFGFTDPDSQKEKLIRIYFQRYAQRPERVDYVDLHWEGKQGKALTPKEIRSLIQIYVYGKNPA